MNHSTVNRGRRRPTAAPICLRDLPSVNKSPLCVGPVSFAGPAFLRRETEVDKEEALCVSGLGEGMVPFF